MKQHFQLDKGRWQSVFLACFYCSCLLEDNILKDKGINIARKIVELGGNAKAYGIISGCAGYYLRDIMTKNRIPFEFVEILQKSEKENMLVDQDIVVKEIKT